MTFVSVPDKAAGDVFTEAMWDTYVRDNLNAGVHRPLFDSTLGGTAGNIDITSIPQTFAHLAIVIYARSDAAANAAAMWLRFNNDTAANYDYETGTTVATTVTAAESFAQTVSRIGRCPAATGTANRFSTTEVLIGHYTGGTNHKTYDARSASMEGTTTGTLQRETNAGGWRVATAISRVTLGLFSGSFVAGTRATLYGLGAV